MREDDGMAMESAGWKRTHMCGLISEEMIGQEVCLMGWVQRERNLGSLAFVDLRDREGVVQVVFSEEANDAGTFAVGTSLSREFVLAVRGTVAARAGAVNEKLPTGRVEIRVTGARLINRAEVPPIYIEDGADEAEAVRLKYRYLDLRRPSMQRTLRMRARVLSAVRRYMDEQGLSMWRRRSSPGPRPRARGTFWCPAAFILGRSTRCPSRRKFTSNC